MYAMAMADERAQEPDRGHRHHADPGRHRRREALRRRVRLLRHHAGGGRQRDHPQLDHPRHDRVRRTTRTSGSCTRRSVRRPRPTRSSAGRPRSSAFQRTALEDTELGGVRIKKGQRVVMSYRSANFDEEVFEDPHTFNILRDPNPHVGFGGTGAHYCIGANLARMTINLIFNAVADHMPDLKLGRRARAATVGVAQRHQALAGRLHRQAPAASRRIRPRPLSSYQRTRRIRVDFTPDPAQQAVADVVTSVLTATTPGTRSSQVG